MTEGVTGIVLAGGHSTRMGRDKAQVTLQGKTLLQHALDGLRPVCSDLIVVTSADGLERHRDYVGSARLIADTVPERGPLAGLYTGLRQASTDLSLAVGCDTPFLQTNLLQLILDTAMGRDAALPLIEGVPQTLLAAYSRDIVPSIEGLLAEGRPGLRRLLPLIDVAYLNETKAAAADPRLLSFFNVNTKADLERAEQLIRGSAMP